MQAGIHPNYHEVKVNCACGAAWTTRSTIKNNELRIEICSSCHPFFTGRQKLVDTEGRVSLFQKKAAKSKAIQEQLAARKAGKTEAAQ
jgi:large subunit ribosomal protein L31